MEASKQPRRRIRQAIYGDRVTVTFRLAPDLHRKLMEYCEDTRQPANTFACEVLAAALRKAGR